MKFAADIQRMCQMSLLTFEVKVKVKIKTAELKIFPSVIGRPWFEIFSPNLAIPLPEVILA